MAEGLHKPGEIAAELGIAANTLRVYASRFGAVLSSAASRPLAGEGGGSGRRVYSARDLEVLLRARTLLASGATYDEALDRLQLEFGAPGGTRARLESGAASPSPHLATLQQAVDAWRSLAEERARELAETRARLTACEALLAAERRRWVESGYPSRYSDSARDPRPASDRGRSRQQRTESAGNRDNPRSSPEERRTAGDSKEERPGSWLSRIFPADAVERES